MADGTIAVTGVDQFQADMARLSNPTQFRELVHALGLIVETAFKKYPSRNSPSRTSVYGSTFMSDKQRRFFFWALRSGAIHVPYRRGQDPRSKNLEQAWSTKMISDISVQIGIPAGLTYGPLMKDADHQTKYAAAVGWRTVQQDIVDVTPQLDSGARAGVAKILGV